MSLLSSFSRLVMTVVIVTLTLFETRQAFGYASGPLAGHTGAPGEATCSTVNCHTPPTSRSGSVSLTGLPTAYTSNTTYLLTVTVTTPVTKYGFQATAINSSGAQAGTFQANSSVQLKTTNILGNSRQYAEHANSSATSSNSWKFNWTSPNSSSSTVSFYVAGMGADADGNLTDDTTYTSSTSVNPATLPAITTQPTNTTVLSGSNVLFVVAANGAPSPGYQWRFNGTNIGNATSSSYTRSNAQTNDAGTYTVAVTNTLGSVTSSPAVLTVYVATAISGQPQSLTVTQGNNATFSVTAGGFPAPGYQWRFANTNIAGATMSSYTRTNAQATNAGSYTVVVTNIVSAITSSVATLTVNYLPVITTQPISQTVSPGSNVTLSVVANGVPSPAYRWRTNAVQIISRTNSSTTITNFQAANEAGYDVVVSNIVGSVTSSTAFLYLNSPPRFTNEMRASNNFSVLLIGAVNTNYIIDVATSLSGWTPVLTNSSTNGIISFSETNILPRGNRLFRARRQ
jgi:hypothetical protein